MALDYFVVRRPYMLAHRGASAYAPENTVAAFDRALALRTDGIETDIRVTRDGVLVLMHDATVDRVTDGTGPLSDLDYDAVSRLDAGVGFGNEYPDARVPRLDEFLARYGGRVPLCLEIKQPGTEAAIVTAVADRGLTADAPPSDVAPPGGLSLPHVVYSSFSFESCEALRLLAPRAVVGFLTPVFDEAMIERVRAAGLGQICPRIDTCTLALVASAHDHGLSVRAWGVRERENLRAALAVGIDGTTCNWPDWTLTPSR
ncbi:MAG: hypothetical protein EPO26_02195 [Chloroflexota bacterium]|nr:MAG: hypothetical protein EPO26_02195 [Chloroflexota bacterium]